MFCNTSHMDRITPLPDHTLCQIGIEFIRIHFFDSARLPDACQIGQCQIVPDQQGGQIARSSSPDHSQIAFDYPEVIIAKLGSYFSKAYTFRSDFLFATS